MKVILADPAIKKALVSISPTSRQNHNVPHGGTLCDKSQSPPLFFGLAVLKLHPSILSTSDSTFTPLVEFSPSNVDYLQELA